MSWIKKKLPEVLLVSLLLATGFYFRLIGISTNHSFWADEAFVSNSSRDILSGDINIIDGISFLSYQGMQIITTVLSFGVFGFSEWSARIPGVIWGTIGIIFAYLLGKKLSNKAGGYLAGYLFAFSQLNLAHSTQAKPFAAIETLVLATIYFLDNHLLISLILAIISSLYNYIGLVAFIPIIISQGKNINLLKKNPIKAIIILSTITILLWFIRFDKIIFRLTQVQYNWISHLRELFWRQYSFIILPGIIGLFTIRDKKILYSIGFVITSIVFSWTFVGYSRNLRYLMPVFGLFIVLFGAFWGNVGEKLLHRSMVICSLVALMVFLGGYKIVRMPSVYYTPNADFFADVQNADYKTFFRKAYEMFPDLDTLPIFTGPHDSLSWYTKRFPTALFSINVTNPTYIDVVQSWQYGSLAKFISEKDKYDKGLVMVHDWQSFMPEEIKSYVKKNMKLELRVESLEVSPDDKWPLELYSWGFDEK